MMLSIFRRLTSLCIVLAVDIGVRTMVVVGLLMDARYGVIKLYTGAIYCRVLVKKCPGCLFNSVEIHCTCHQL